jgi:hypothetical protein
MAKKGMAAIIMAVLVAGVASAQITISGGFALSRATLEAEGMSFDGEIGYGGNVYLDYLLPLSFPLSLGAEVGYDTSTFSEDGASVTVGAIPILLRAAYHFDIHPKMDLYLVGKIGYAVGMLSGDVGDDVTAKGGVGFGIDAGLAFYFTPLVGIFGEAGFDMYALSAEAGSITIKSPLTRFVTAGLSIKF